MDRTPRPKSTGARVVTAIAVFVFAAAGITTAAATTGVFESNDSGVDSARDVAERGTTVPSSPSTSQPSTTLPDEPGGTVTTTDAGRVENTSFVDVPEGTTQTFGAGVAGSVTISRAGNTLSVVSVAANPGWVPEVEQASGVELEVNFTNGRARADFNAELEDGVVRIRVRLEGVPVAPAPTSNPAPTPTQAPVRIDNSGPGSLSSGPGNAEDGDHSGHDGSDDSGHSGGGESGGGGSGRDHAED